MDFWAGTGGEEGFFWAEELAEYYLNYISNKGFKVQEERQNKQITFSVYGDGIYDMIKHENGGQKVQRVPINDKHGRMHSSMMKMIVLPLVPFEFNIS